MSAGGRRGGPGGSTPRDGSDRRPGEPNGGGPPGPSAASRLDALPDAVAETDAAGVIIWANEVFHTLFSGAPGRFRGESARLIAGPYADEAEGDSLLELVVEGHGGRELMAFSQQGVSFPALVRVRTPGDRPDRRLVVVTDVSERERLRAELVIRADAVQREKEMLRATTEVIAEGVLVADDAERIVLVNRNAAALLGLSGRQLQGRPLATLDLPGSLRGRWLSFLSAGGSFDRFLLEAQEDRGLPALEAQVARISSPRGLPVGSLLVLAEENGGADLGRIGHGELIRGLVHELRTPLTSISGFISTLAETRDLDEQTRQEFLGILRMDTSRLGALVENLIELAELDIGSVVLERSDVNLSELIRDAVRAVGREVGRPEEEFRVELPGSPVIASIDRRRIRQALMELLRNAVRHGWSSKGVSISLSVDDRSATASVRDWGDSLARSGDAEGFDALTRHFASRGGANVPERSRGIGLTVCRRVAEHHDGELDVERPADGGLRVDLRLPL